MIEENLEQHRDLLVKAMLVHVPLDGWAWPALEAGAKDLGKEAGYARRAFSGGLGEVADHFARWSDRRMLAELAIMDLEGMRIRDRIHACVKTRLAMNAEHKEAMRRLLSFLALPQNAGRLSEMTWRTCSEMWYAAGDTSTDWNHYSKRGLLASVYSSTILYWMVDEGDENGDFPETWGFLDRRIDDVLKTFGMPRRIKERLGRLLPPVNPFRRRSA